MPKAKAQPVFRAKIKHKAGSRIASRPRPRCISDPPSGSTQHQNENDSRTRRVLTALTSVRLSVYEAKYDEKPEVAFVARSYALLRANLI